MASSTIFTSLAVWLLVLGVGKTFYGRKFFRWWLALQGVLVGVFGGLILGIFLGAEGYLGTGDGALLWGAFIVAYGGYLGWNVAFRAYQLGLFLTVGLVLGGFTYLLSGSSFLAVVVALLGGGLALVFERKIVIYYTAITGGFSLAYGLELLGSPSLSTWTSSTGWPIPVGLMLAGLGVYVQENYTDPAVTQDARYVDPGDVSSGKDTSSATEALRQISKASGVDPDTEPVEAEPDSRTDGPSGSAAEGDVERTDDERSASGQASGTSDTGLLAGRSIWG